MTIAPGTDVLLGERYRLVSRIAAGGMGEVWSATTPTRDPKTPSTAPITALVSATDYLGKPVADASAALRALDLTVSLRPVPADPGTPIGSVTGVTPTGRLSAGATVTVEVAQAPAGPVTKPGKHDHEPPGQKKKDNRKQGKP